MTTKAKAPEPVSAEYKNMVDLLAIFSDADNRLANLAAEVDSEMLEVTDSRRAEYARLQEILIKTETALEAIALAHPDWFATRQSIKTPYGSVAFRQSKVLEIPNAEVTLVLLEKESEQDKKFNLETYTRTKREINLEAFEQADESFLAKFRIRRVEKQNFKVTAAKVDMGKAVKISSAAEAA